jgi:5,10-methylenetetrahydromethanopterin reductase
VSRTDHLPTWGLWLEPVSPVRRLVELAVTAEREGATHVFVADEGTDRDVYVALTAILLATDSVVVGAGITNPYSRHPVVTAAALATLDELAPGRVIAGWGVGGARVLPPLGLEAPRPYTTLVEAVAVVDRLLAGERVDHVGQFQVDGAELPWAPGRLPLAVAGRGPRVESWAATHAQYLLLSAKPIAELAGFAASVRARASAAGHEIRIAWSPYLAPTRLIEDAIRPHFTYATVDMPPETREALGIPDAVVAQVRELMLTQGIQAAGAYVPPSVVARAAVVGTPESIVTQLSAVREAAAPELFLLPIHDHADGDWFIPQAAALLRTAGFGSMPEPALAHR